MLPTFNSFEIFIVTAVASYLSLLVTHVHSQPLLFPIRHSHLVVSFLGCLGVSFVLDIPRHSMGLFRCIVGLPRSERLRAF
jgi:hypothetical protein